MTRGLDTDTTSSRSSCPVTGSACVATAAVGEEITSNATNRSSADSAFVVRSGSGNETTGLPPLTKSARRCPASMSSGMLTEAS
jgi:hypothetical protein